LVLSVENFKILKMLFRLGNLTLVC
jgi:hypothetical protein